MIDIDKFRSMFGGYFSNSVEYPDAAIEEAYDLAMLIEGDTIQCWPSSKRDAAMYYLTAHYLTMSITPQSSSFDPFAVSVGVADAVSIGTISVSKSNKITSNMGLNDQDYTKTQFGKTYLQIKSGIKTPAFRVISKSSCGC
jgi:Protein of unknown function (DUF4054)